MKDYRLSKEKIAELEKFHRSLRDKRQADRIKAVLALSRGWAAARVPSAGLTCRRLQAASDRTKLCSKAFRPRLQTECIYSFLSCS